MDYLPDLLPPVSKDAMYRFLVQSVTDYAICMLDKDGLVANWNAGAERAKGYKPEEIIGRHFSCFYTPEDAAAGKPALALSKALTDGKFEGEGWRVKKDGTRFWANIVIHPVTDDHGQPIGYAKITRDLTHARNEAEKLADQEHIFRLLVQGVTDYAIYLLNPDGTIANWNAGAERAKGYKAEEIIGQDFARFYPEADRAAGLPHRNLHIALAEGKFEGEGWRLRKDGSRFWAHIVIDPIYNDHGRHIGFAKITRDMSDKRDALEQERAFRQLVQGVTDYAIYLLNPEGIVENWNAGAERAKGYSAAEIVGKHFSTFYTEEERLRGRPQRALATAIANGKFEGEGWRVKKDGSRFWAHVIIDPIYNDAGDHIGFAKITRDLSNQKDQLDRVGEIKNNLDLALAHMSQGLVLFDARERVVLRNEKIIAMFGMPEGSLKIGSTLTDFMWDIYGALPLRQEELTQKIARARLDHLARMQGGQPALPWEFPWQDRVFSISQNPLPQGGWVVTVEDITERRQIETRIAHMSMHDTLTALPNRKRFRDTLETALAEAPGGTVAVLAIDLDRFKPINDMFGRSIGDAVLKITADRLKTQLRRQDMVARLGGDEFAILLADNATRQYAQTLAARLVRELSHNIEVGGVSITIGASVGIAIAPEHGIDPDELLRNADLAVNRAKRAGRGRHRFYDPEMETMLQQRQGMEADLRTALANGELSIRYQPVVERPDRALSGFEALLRWTSPTRGPVPASEFIPFAEEVGLMTEIGDWVLRTACREALNWPEHILVSVNLSPTQFVMPDLVERISGILAEIGLSPHRLELEITETAMIDDMAAAARTLQRLRELGILIAMDDFGTGYSSLSFLRAMPLTRIKIDRSFVQDLGRKPEGAAIVRAVVGMGEGIGVAVTAEGVETEDQAGALKQLGCSTLQGYLISRPMLAAEASAWIETHPTIEPTQ